jgi:hypothetical protein
MVELDQAAVGRADLVVGGIGLHAQNGIRI